MTDLASVFSEHRPQLFGLAYRMLGSASDAEDVLQEAWLRASASGETPRNARAYLSTIVTRLCLDVLKSARRTRETYVGPWLPEPLPTELADAGPADRMETAESVTMAFLLVLETLSPLERAVFLMREVFELDFVEIAPALGRSEGACRQLLHRAREHLEERRPRFRPSAQAAQALTADFLQAVAVGDPAVLARLFAPDVLATTDSGGKVSAARRTIHGADAVSRFVVGLTRKAASDIEFVPTVLNGQPAVVFKRGEQVTGTIILECGETAIHAIRLVLNPEKLRHLQ